MAKQERQQVTTETELFLGLYKERPLRSPDSALNAKKNSRRFADQMRGKR
jgi:hypothetical protein